MTFKAWLTDPSRQSGESYVYYSGPIPRPLRVGERPSVLAEAWDAHIQGAVTLVQRVIGSRKTKSGLVINTYDYIAQWIPADKQAGFRAHIMSLRRESSLGVTRG